MKKQISFIAPGQTAKALILVYLTFSVPIVLLGVLVAFFRYGSVELSTVFSALLLNAILGFILLWIACHAYNWVASRFGGIEIVLVRRAGGSVMSRDRSVAAAPADVGAIFALMLELAEFEKLTHLFVATEARRARRVVRRAAVAPKRWWRGRRRPHRRLRAVLPQLLDLPRQARTVSGRPVRAAGHARQRARHADAAALAALAVERQCGRFEWTVLDWNQQAIGFYEKMGATVLPDWRIVRITGDALDALARARSR